MAAIKTDAAAIIVIFGAILAATLDTRGAASSSSSCDDEVSRLTPCYSYIEGSGSNRPTSECCSQLGSTAATKPECLCRILDADNNLNKTRIMALPKACNVTTPPASACRQSSTLPPSGHSTKISNSLQLSIIPASYAAILIIILFIITI